MWNFWGNGAFDVKELFNLLKKYGNQSAIPTRENAAKKAKGGMRSRREFREYKQKTWGKLAKDK